MHEQPSLFDSPLQTSRRCVCLTEAGLSVQLHSQHANLLGTKRLSSAGLLQQSATTETQERMWPNLPFVLQNLYGSNEAVCQQSR